jgi:threonine synthase
MGSEDNNLKSVRNSTFQQRKWCGIIHEYGDFISVEGEKINIEPVTLLEGNTPLIESVCLVKELKDMGFSGKIYFKYEGLNPTSSFKDRGMTVAITRAKQIGARATICASTGNTSASAAAYSARANLPVFVVVPEKNVATGKIVQAVAYGARIIRIKGNFDDALKLVRKISDDFGLFIVNSINPWRIEGQKTAAFEVCDALGFAPDYHFLPVGNAGNIYAYWLGYKQYKAIGRINETPKMFGFQAEGAAPIVRGYPIENPETIASAIRIGNPANWEKAELAVKESDGLIDMVSDEEIISVYRFMGEKEGIFCEPAPCAGIAGLIKMVKNKRIKMKDIVVVCTLTGHGLKDPEAALNFIKTKQFFVEPKFNEIKKIIEEEIKKSKEKDLEMELQRS